MKSAKQWHERFSGPGISVVFHVVLIGLMMKFMVATKVEDDDEPMIDVVFQPPVEITEKPIDLPPEELPKDPFFDDNDSTLPTIESDPEIDNSFDEFESDVEMPAIEGLHFVPDSPFHAAVDTSSGKLNAKDRLKALKRTNKDTYKLTERAVDRVLAWLVKSQHEKGFWPGDNSAGIQHRHAMTSLGTLCMLARGVTPATDVYGESLEKALLWLVDNIDTETGLIKSGVSSANYQAYENAIVCYAICEAAGIVNNVSVNEAMNSMVARIVANQREDGTWAYRYARTSGHSDLSLAGWHIQALSAAQKVNCKVPGLEDCIQKASETLIDSIQTDGTAYYDPAGRRSKRLSMGAVAGLCLQMVGEGKHTKVDKAIKGVAKEFRKAGKEQSLFRWNSPAVTARKADWNVIMYDWYYQTQLVFRSKNPSLWKEWNRQLLAGELIKSQVVEKEGDNAYAYWNWPGDKSNRTGWRQMYATCLNCLSLEVYYRHLPSNKVYSGTSFAEKTFGGEELL